MILGAVPGCGSADPSNSAPTTTQSLSAAEHRAASSGHAAIRSYCRRLGAQLARGRPAPAPAALERAVAGARTIAMLARRKPEAPYSRMQTIRDLAGDTAEDLEGTNCSSTLVAELARGL